MYSNTHSQLQYLIYWLVRPPFSHIRGTVRTSDQAGDAGGHTCIGWDLLAILETIPCMEEHSSCLYCIFLPCVITFGMASFISF